MSNQCKVNDPAVEALRAARSRPAVLKVELATLRSSAPEMAILAFEGDDDKIIYRQWITRVCDRFRYVSFPCRGKGHLLDLRSSLKKDRTGLAAGVYFFVDRDFDDLRGHEHANDVFMTERYSTENYLVDPTVIDIVLEIEFHCHDVPVLRKQLVDLFEERYDQFLLLTREVNRRLYRARRSGVEVKTLPKSVGKLAEVGVRSVSDGTGSPDTLVIYLSEPDCSQFSAWDNEFDQFEPRLRYRGKFSLLFMQRWLRELAAEAASPGRGVFSNLGNHSAVRVSELTLSCFASRCNLPNGLAEFIRNMVSLHTPELSEAVR